MMPVQLSILSSVDPEWQSHRHHWKDCMVCEIGKLANKHVFTRGVLPCDVLFLGEAPGDTEDELGFPFVGKAGKILDRFINELSSRWFRSLSDERRLKMVFQRGGLHGEAIRWAITNTVLCRPADDRQGHFREPSPEEKSNCRPRLDDFIQNIAKPKAIICLGRHAQRAGPFINEDIEEIPYAYIKHPSAIGRMGGRDSEPGKVAFEESIVRSLEFLAPILK